MPNVDAAEKVLLPVLKETAGIAGAYLFGSVLGKMRPDSDIDLAIVSTPGADPFRAAADVESRIREIEGHPLQVTILSESGVRFAMEAMSTGQLIYVADEEALTDFMERVSVRFADADYLYRRAMEDIYG